MNTSALESYAPAARDDFIAALGAYCRADPDMLLAAAIDLSVLSLAE